MSGRHNWVSVSTVPLRSSEEAEAFRARGVQPPLPLSDPLMKCGVDEAVGAGLGEV